MWQKLIKKKIQVGLEGWLGGSDYICAALPGSCFASQYPQDLLTAAYNLSSKGSDAIFWPPEALYSRIQTHAYTNN